jgi:hypothetical protein
VVRLVTTFLRSGRFLALGNPIAGVGLNPAMGRAERRAKSREAESGPRVLDLG